MLGSYFSRGIHIQFSFLLANLECMSQVVWSQLSLLHREKLLVEQLFISKCLHAVGLFELIDRCGESIAVLNEGFKHLNQATHLAKVSTGNISCI